MVGVKGIEEKSGICAGVCRISVDKFGFQTGEDFLLLWSSPNPSYHLAFPAPPDPLPQLSLEWTAASSQALSPHLLEERTESKSA